MDSAETCLRDLIVDDTYLDFSVLQSKLKFNLQLLSQHLYLKPKPAKAQAHWQLAGVTLGYNINM